MLIDAKRRCGTHSCHSQDGCGGQDCGIKAVAFLDECSDSHGGEHVEIIRRRWAVGAEAHSHACGEQLGNTTEPRRQFHIRTWTMGDRSVRFRQSCDFRISKDDSVCKNRALTKKSVVVE